MKGRWNPSNFSRTMTVLIGLTILMSCFSQTFGGARCYTEERKHDRGEIISSPSELQYPNNYCKYWRIQGAPNDVVTISFDYMDILRGDDNFCNRDFLEIGPNPSKTYCGKSAKPYIAQLTQLKMYVWLKFSSDDADHSRGFKLHYIIGSVPSQRGCHNDETKCQNGKCIYTIWRCNGMDECGDNSDEENCFSGTVHPTEPPVGLCESPEIKCAPTSGDSPVCLHQNQQCDNVRDCVDGSDESPSLCGQSGASCRYHLDKTYGNFTSPNYPEDYPNAKDCEWTIHLKMSAKIQLRFTDFQLQADPETDYVILYDGKNEDSDIIGKYNGKLKPPALIESTRNYLYIKFHSDAKYPEKGFSATYQEKGVCIHNQKPCGFDENDCYNASERCNGIWNCKKRGGDERGCATCHANEFSCGVATVQCYKEEKRCDGDSQCFNYADEENCTADRCGPNNGLFLCGNKRCIFETWKCDLTNDCGDSTDEENCPISTTRVIIAAVVGSLVCSLLLVVALGCTCKVYVLRMHEQYGPRYETPLSRLQAEFIRRRAPPPPYHEAMLTSRPFEEVRQEYLGQNHDNHRRRASDRRRNRPLPPTLENQLTNQSAADSEQSNNVIDDDDVPLISLGPTSADLDLFSSSVQLIPPTTTSESEDNTSIDHPGNDESVHINISEGAGVTASWRSMSQKNVDEGRSLNQAATEGCGDSVDSASASISLDNVTIPETMDKENSTDVKPGVSHLEITISDNIDGSIQSSHGGSQNSLSSLESEGLYDSHQQLIQ